MHYPCMLHGERRPACLRASPGGELLRATPTRALACLLTAAHSLAHACPSRRLALAQAMPGPLFNFAAYLGAVIAQNAGWLAIWGVAICWVALFAPGILLIFAIL